MPRSHPGALFLAEASANVPLVAVVASIGVQFDALEGPGELGLTGGLLLSPVGPLGRAVTLEVRRDRQ